MYDDLRQQPKLEFCGFIKFKLTLSYIWMEISIRILIQSSSRRLDNTCCRLMWCASEILSRLDMCQLRFLPQRRAHKFETLRRFLISWRDSTDRTSIYIRLAASLWFLLWATNRILFLKNIIFKNSKNQIRNLLVCSSLIPNPIIVKSLSPSASSLLVCKQTGLIFSVNLTGLSSSIKAMSWYRSRAE